MLPKGIGRCCTRGFAGVEGEATVGQWAESGAWDYFVKRGLAQRVVSMPASCDSSVQLNNCQWPRSYQITTPPMQKAKTRRLICSGLRYALLDMTAIVRQAEEACQSKFTTPLGYTGSQRSSAVEEDLLHLNTSLNKLQYESGISINYSL